MKHVLILILTSVFTVSCISDSTKKQVDDAFTQIQTTVADTDFQKAIAFIELHKLRYGSYPTTIYDLKFVNSMDSASLRNVEYYKLDSGYELNLRTTGVSITGEERALPLRYPKEFWKGLGCVQSNLKR